MTHQEALMRCATIQNIAGFALRDEGHPTTLRNLFHAPLQSKSEPNCEQDWIESFKLSAKAKALTLKFSFNFLLLALLTSGCAHYPVNAPQAKVNPAVGYRFQNAVTQTNADDLLLMLAFSGGGLRATALSYGVLEQLAKTQVGPAGHEHRLLDDAEIVSATSGGSFTAAYYALWGDRIFSDFEPRFLKKHVQTGLLLRTLAPWNTVRLASPKFSNSDLAAEYYDHLLFNGATFGELTRNPAAFSHRKLHGLGHRRPL